MNRSHSTLKARRRIRVQCASSDEVFRRGLVALLSCIVLSAVAAQAQSTQSPLPENLFDHAYWSFKGNYAYEYLGSSGLSYIGRVSTSIPHAYAIAQKGVSCLVYNQHIGDTVCRAGLYGWQVYPGNLNGDSLPDLVCWNNSAHTVTVLFGTEKPDEFTVAMQLHGKGGELQFLDGNVIVGDCDGDGIDDLVISDGEFMDSTGQFVGHILYFRGGPVMRDTATMELIGKSKTSNVGGLLGYANVRDRSHMYLVEFRYSPGDTTHVMLYPCGQGFTLIPSDTLYLNISTGGSTTSYAAFDFDGDSVADLAVGGGNSILIFKGGDTIASHPSMSIRRPWSTGSSTFASKIIDIGNATSPAYHTILVTDPEASLGGVENGAVYLFNIGAGFKDACVGYATGDGFFEHFGLQAIPLGDIDGDGLADFAVASNPDSGFMSSVGQVFIFRGSAKYVGVERAPVLPAVDETVSSYPEPATGMTSLAYRIPASWAGKETTISVSDLLGRRIQTAYRGDDREGVALVDFTRYPAGTYVCTLAMGRTSQSILIHIVHY
jgi:hypothetical protein